MRCQRSSGVEAAARGQRRERLRRSRSGSDLPVLRQSACASAIHCASARPGGQARIQFGAAQRRSACRAVGFHAARNAGQSSRRAVAAQPELAERLGRRPGRRSAAGSPAPARSTACRCRGAGRRTRPSRTADGGPGRRTGWRRTGRARRPRSRRARAAVADRSDGRRPRRVGAAMRTARCDVWAQAVATKALASAASTMVRRARQHAPDYSPAIERLACGRMRCDGHVGRCAMCMRHGAHVIAPIVCRQEMRVFIALLRFSRWARSPACWPACSASAADWCWSPRWSGCCRRWACRRKRRCMPRWPVRWRASC